MGEEKKSAQPPSVPAGETPHYPLLITRYLVITVVAAMTLVGCGTVSRREAPLPPHMEKTPPGGGYYLDDGPGENPPADLARIPDAVPKIEPLHRGASRPYTVMGRNYTPMTSLQPYKARGLATWYGRRYHGKPTSSGELYDMYAMSAAHATLPIPSYARVTNLANGKSAVVRINDRGPFRNDRLIDLSYTAAYKLGLLNDGSATVEVESILPGDGAPALVASAPAQPALSLSRAVTRSATPEPAPVAAPANPPLGAATGVYLQFGAFGSKENADNYLAKLKVQLEWLAERLHIFPRGGLYRVHAGPYADQAEARQIAERVKQVLGVSPMLFNR